MERHAAAHREARQRRLPAIGHQRVIIERVEPELDAGRFAIKRTPGEQVTVTADVFADGHDLLAGVVKYRPVSRAAPMSSAAEPGTDRPPEPAAAWSEVPLTPGD